MKTEEMIEKMRKNLGGAPPKLLISQLLSALHVSRYQSCFLKFCEKLTNLNHDTICATMREMIPLDKMFPIILTRQFDLIE